MSPDPSVVPYGAWPSPVSAASLTADSVVLAEPRLDGDDVYWLEGRPAEGGRVVVVRRTPDGQTHDVTGAPYNVRSRVHEYGGGAYDVRDGVLVFCNLEDTRVYRMDVRAGDSPVPITPGGALRYGDLRYWPGSASLSAVREDHTGAGEPVNSLVRLELHGDNAGGGQVLVEGPDFVSSAAVHSDGRRIAWVQWSHPHMPFDSTELCVGEVTDAGRVVGTRRIAGGPEEAAIQPQWSGDRLVFISDRTGWWNLYADEAGRDAPVALYPAAAEFGDPQWAFGMSACALAPGGRIVCTWVENDTHHLGILDTSTSRLTPVSFGAVFVGAVQALGSRVVARAGFPDRPDALVRLDLADLDGADLDGVEILRASSVDTLDPEMVSVAEPLTWPAPDGSAVHGFYYPPRNRDFVGPADELPPLLVMSHGGPTSMTTATYTRARQFWTTRGFAVLDVNYGGSCGYGRAYRERLRGQWGVVDVDDCASGAQAMVAMGRADPARLAIRGGSAGGYTTLAALTFRDVFTAGASLFGIGDLETLARDTHKFESRYLDGLIGPYPERRDLYRERSPIHHVEQLHCPMILLQGREDQVVPLNQAESMAAAVRANGLPVALLVFDGEGHGFRRAENQIRALEAEAYFYSRVFGFALADDVDPVEIENLPPG
jgi:dipeptidyl aminopeptidase/acylaminoacyl peptidase